VEVTVTREGEEARITVDAVDEDGAFVNGMTARMSVLGPDDVPVQVELVQTAPGRYEGTFIPQGEGAYPMRLVGSLGGEEVVALTTGWAMGYSPEYAVLEGDPTYLSGLAEIGGGAVLEEPSGAIAHDVRGTGSRRNLWPYLLAAATLLLPFDIAVRRLALGRRDWVRLWNWVTERLSRRRHRAPETESPVGRLFEAKARSEARRPAGRGLEGDAVSAPEVPQTRPAASPPPAERRDAPSATPRPDKPPTDGAAEGETLAGRLLKKKRRRED
jgi:hypothetical protein